VINRSVAVVLLGGSRGIGRAGGEPVHHQLANSWVITNPGGGSTPDKPDISVVNYDPGDTVSCFMNLRVAVIQVCDEQWSAKGDRVRHAGRSIAVLRSVVTCETPTVT
jgi:hypothetical protein